MVTVNRNKNYLTLDQQINKLKGKNLYFNDEEQAKKTLIKTSYYNLINGYKDCFLKPESETEQFEDGVTFEDIYMLYIFDENLRKNILNICLSIEENIASTLAYVISDIYGADNAYYLNATNLRRGDSKRKANTSTTERDEFLKILGNKILYATDGPVKHYKDNYTNIPAWILVKVLSFGNLKMWYKLSKPPVKNRVISIFLEKEESDVTDKDKEIFMKCLEIINQFRNKVAHGGRTYNHVGRIELPYRKIYHENILNISTAEYTSGKGKSDLTSFIIAVLILSDKSFSTYDVQLKRFISAFQLNLRNYIHYNKKFSSKVLRAMNIESNIMNKILKKLPNITPDVYTNLYVEELDNESN